MTIREIKEETLALHPSERKDLAYFLLDSLIDSDVSLDDELSAPWKNELDNRLFLYKSNILIVEEGIGVENKLMIRHGIQH